MTDDRILAALWPGWARTAGTLLAAGAHLRSQCLVCGTRQRVDVSALVTLNGALWSPIDALDRCTIVGCAGSVHYCARRGFDRPWIRLIGDPELVAHAGPEKSAQDATA
ncbi:hypothetical protein FIM10_18635 [Sphingomonadales bacterium 56]|uniref:Uncharacterized protein n=1 Tax=Sphingobium indicum TaxID=332055 RepID=A0A4Q4ISM3_9SPHN|nr:MULTISPECIES: hypothetical protein [Sphingobium]MBY2930700.1 hypothetical protein [Sphingomonadales bacterium 56]MBY2960758.1 hypothetical protein [Sphingomonadales bacterium 58]NYI25034.1 hypothetical protein [Sphingobium indicum]RYL96463.1 hypothetical protein EWH08_19795 [Sphingobium indicum]